MTPAFPNSIESMTPAWLTASLQSAGALGPANAVTYFDARPVAAQGTASLVARVELTYRSTDGAGPASLAAKLPSAKPEVKQAVNATGAPFREVGFYRHMMEAGPPPAVPTCYAAEYDRETGDFILLLEDLSSWRTGDVLATRPEDVSALLGAMAKFHVRHWDKPLPPEAKWLGRSNARRAVAISGLIAANLPLCRELFPGNLGPNTAAVAELVIADPRTFALLGEGPQTLLHGDLHCQNAMWLDDAVRAIDWQSCLSGHPSTDVARLLMTSLTTPQRRLLENDLIRSYCDRLAELGIRGYHYTQASEDFAVGLIHNVMVYLLSMPIIDLESMKRQEEATGVSVLNATFTRLEAALEDHDTLSVVTNRLDAL